MRLRGFARDRRGVAAVEFAILSSFILLPLFLGLIEILTLYRAEAKLTALTADIAEMVSYVASGPTGITSLPVPAATGAASLTDICQGAVSGLAPFPGSALTIAIASVTLEFNLNGLPAPVSPATKPYYSSTPTYDEWEADFSVSNGTCTPTTPTGTGDGTIGHVNAELLATTSPPSTGGPTGGSTTWTGMLAVPCDNAIIVKANMTYPGLIGVVLRTRPTLSQTSFSRWANTWTEAELQCSGNYCATNYAATQVCNTTNTTATN